MADDEVKQPRRAELVQALQDALGVETVRPTAWALVWLSELDKLEVLVKDARARPSQVKSILTNTETEAQVSKRWMHNKRSKAETTPQPASPSLEVAQGQKRKAPDRSRAQRELCAQRDRRRCVLTSGGKPFDVAHIFPVAMRNERDVPLQYLGFWEALRSFWSEERIKSWYDAIFTQGTETCANLLCLSTEAHAYWSEPYFALKPIRVSDDGTQAFVEFYWLRTNEYHPSKKLTDVPTVANLDGGAELARLWNKETLVMITSGTLISISTNDKVARPLPDMRILELQWMLHRVAAISGAADLPDSEAEDEDDDEDIKEPSPALILDHPETCATSNLIRLHTPSMVSISMRGGGEEIKEECSSDEQDS